MFLQKHQGSQILVAIIQCILTINSKQPGINQANQPKNQITYHRTKYNTLTPSELRNIRCLAVCFTYHVDAKQCEYERYLSSIYIRH